MNIGTPVTIITHKIQRQVQVSCAHPSKSFTSPGGAEVPTIEEQSVS